MTALAALSVLVAVSTVMVAVMAAKRYVVASLGRLDLHIAVVERELRSWQHAHDHHLTELHRRLTGIEQATTRAETEARAVSDHLVKLNTDQPVHEVRT